MKRCKKFIILFFVAAMLISAISGCSKEEKDNKQGNTNQYADHIKFTMSAIDAERAGLTDNGEVAANFKWICDKFNVEFEFWPLTWSYYIDQTRLWLNSDSAPDIIMLDISGPRYSEFLDWVDAGLFKPYPDLSNYPNLQAHFNNMITGKEFEVNGSLYAWPAYSDAVKYNYVPALGYTYRKDWAKAVGLWNENDSYTWDEWQHLVKTVVEQDPGKNGPGNTIGMMVVAWGFPKYITGGISPYFDTFTKAADGKWIWGPSLPESLDAVKAVKQMYDNGLVWSDQPMIKEGDTGNNLEAGKLFALANTNLIVDGFYKTVLGFESAQSDINAEEAIGIANVKGPDSKYITWQSYDQWSQTAMNYNLSDEKAARWTAILDFLTSKDGYNFINYGIQGVDWKYGDQGEVINLRSATDGIGDMVNPYGMTGTWPWARAANCNDGFAMENPAYPEWIRNLVKKQMDLYSSSETTIIPLNVNLAFFTNDTYDRAVTGLEDTVHQKVAELMTSKDVAKKWTDWVNQMLVEVQPALDELNKNLK